MDPIIVPEIQHFSDITDEKMFRFKIKKKTDLIIQKISPNYYSFGTRKIMASVSNGVLLIRVGGGYQNIDDFWDMYGE